MAFESSFFALCVAFLTHHDIFSSMFTGAGLSYLSCVEPSVWKVCGKLSFMERRQASRNSLLGVAMDLYM